MKVFLDTNVLLDLLSTTERPSSEAARIIFQAIRSGYLEGVLTTQSIVDANYILSRLGQGFSAEAFAKTIISLINFVNISGLNSFDLQEALLHPTGDFEDDVQFAHAEAEGCDVFLTSDQGLLKRTSEIGMQILPPTQFVARMTAR